MNIWVVHIVALFSPYFYNLNATPTFTLYSQRPQAYFTNH